MQSAIAEQPATMSRRRARSSNDLVNVAAPVLELVLKLRAGIVKPSSELRRTAEELLGQMEQRGTNLRYNSEYVKAVKFALAAFVDETVLTANFPLRDEWEKYPLQLTYFGEHLAGVKFFDRLTESLKNAEKEADVIEVYYLCLLFGFKGKYKVYLEEQLKGVIADVAEQLRKVGRLQDTELSPHWRVSDQPELPRDPGLPLWLKIGGGAVIGLVILIFMVLEFLIRSDVNTAKEQLLR
jgi:type VI secretion system protein ImpK